METMIDNMIALDRPDIALKMEWVELAYNQTDDENMAFKEMLVLQKNIS